MHNWHEGVITIGPHGGDRVRLWMVSKEFLRDATPLRKRLPAIGSNKQINFIEALIGKNDIIEASNKGYTSALFNEIGRYGEREFERVVQ